MPNGTQGGVRGRLISPYSIKSNFWDSELQVSVEFFCKGIYTIYKTQTSLQNGITKYKEVIFMFNKKTKLKLTDFECNLLGAE